MVEQGNGFVMLTYQGTIVKHVKHNKDHVTDGCLIGLKETQSFKNDDCVQTYDIAYYQEQYFVTGKTIILKKTKINTRIIIITSLYVI